MANDDCLNSMELPSDLFEENFAAYWGPVQELHKSWLQSIMFVHVLTMMLHLACRMRLGWQSPCLVWLWGVLGWVLVLLDYWHIRYVSSCSQLVTSWSLVPCVAMIRVQFCCSQLCLVLWVFFRIWRWWQHFTGAVLPFTTVITWSLRSSWALNVVQFLCCALYWLSLRWLWYWQTLRAVLPLTSR